MQKRINHADEKNGNLRKNSLRTSFEKTEKKKKVERDSSVFNKSIKIQMKLSLYLLSISLFFNCLVHALCSDMTQLNKRSLELSCSSNSVTFASLGDWGIKVPTAVSNAITMALQSRSSNLDFIYAAGDNFYSRGVNSIYDPLWNSTWFSRYSIGEKLNVPWIAALGNHDYYGNSNAQIDYTSSTCLGASYWWMPATYYGLHITSGTGKSADLFITDTEVVTDTQKEWLRTSLQKSTSQIKIVLGHSHVYSNGYRGDGSGATALNTCFKAGRVLAYISGHEHDLQYLSYDNIDYFVVGGSGASLRPGKNTTQARVHLYQQRHGFALHTLNLQLQSMTTCFHMYTITGNYDGEHCFNSTASES